MCLGVFPCKRTTGATYSPSGLRGWHDNIVAKAEGDPMDFTKGPWVRMMEDLDMSGRERRGEGGGTRGDGASPLVPRLWWMCAG